MHGRKITSLGTSHLATSLRPYGYRVAAAEAQQTSDLPGRRKDDPRRTAPDAGCNAHPTLTLTLYDRASPEAQSRPGR